MRTVLIPTVALLVAVAAISQRAIEGPRPPGVAKSAAGLVEQVACVSPKNCAAVGRWLYTEQAGKWKANEVPSLPHTSGTTLRALSCPRAGRCVAVGRGGAQHAVRLTESGRRWRLAEFPLPPDAAPIKPPRGPYPGVTISCASAGDCVVVGYYGAADRTARPLLITEHRGTWGRATDVPLPPDASTTFPPPDGESFVGGLLSSASCPSPAGCTTLGSYTRREGQVGTGGVYPWALDETGGQWATGAGLQLPAGAATSVDSRAGGASPFMGFSGLSCPSAGNCTAVGGYVDRHSDFQGAIFTESHGTWSKGMRAPAPADAASNNDPMELLNPMTAVSCAAPDDCGAVGWFVTGPNEIQHGLLLAEHQGTWKASALTLPRGARARGGVFLTSVSCPSRGNCVAVGYYAAHGKTDGLIVRERAGRWERAVEAAVPTDGAPESKSHTFLNSVSCPSTSACMAGGYYADRTGVTQGLLVNLRLG